MVAFDREDAEEPKDVMGQLSGLKLEFDQEDVDFWISQLELHMATAGVKRQWTKRLLLQKHLPVHVWSEMKDILRKDVDKPARHHTMT